MNNPGTNQLPDDIAALFTTFLERWNVACQRHPIYQLDMSWPSVGVIDMCLKHLRSRMTFQKMEIHLIHSAAVYLAVVAQSIWQQFPDKPDTEIFRDKENGDIILRARGGMYLATGEHFTVNVSQTLFQLISREPTQLPVINGFVRQVDRQENTLSTICLGIFSGMSEIGDGGWARISNALENPRSYITSSFLAKSCAFYAKRVFSDDLIAQNSALYYEGGLISPPLGYDEQPIGASRVLTLLDYMRSKGLTNEQMLLTATNLSQNPDNQISWLGLALSIALTNSTPYPATLRYAVQARRTSSCLLRPAVLALRSALGMKSDWLKEFQEGKIQRAVAMLEADYILGLNTSLIVSPLAFQDLPEKLRGEILLSHSWNIVPELLSMFTFLEKKKQLSAMLCLQAAFNEIIVGRLDKAEQYLLLSRKMPDWPRTEELGLCDYLHGRVFENRNELAAAVIAYGTASQKQFPLFSGIRAECFSRIANIHITMGNIDKALEINTRALKVDPYHLASRFHRIAVLRAKEDGPGVTNELEQLAFLAPKSQRLFNLLLYGEG